MNKRLLGPTRDDDPDPRWTMLKTPEAVLETDGSVRLLEDVDTPRPKRVLVTILEDPHAEQANETALLSEAALAEDWDREEEHEAWKHLQPAL